MTPTHLEALDETSSFSVYTQPQTHKKLGTVAKDTFTWYKLVYWSAKGIIYTGTASLRRNSDLLKHT